MNSIVWEELRRLFDNPEEISKVTFKKSDNGSLTMVSYSKYGNVKRHKIVPFVSNLSEFSVTKGDYPGMPRSFSGGR